MAGYGLTPTLYVVSLFDARGWSIIPYSSAIPKSEVVLLTGLVACYLARVSLLGVVLGFKVSCFGFSGVGAGVEDFDWLVP